MSDVSSPSNVSDITVKILESIRDEIRGLRGEVVELRERVDTNSAELRVLTSRVEEGFASVNGELRSLNRRTERLEHEATGTNQRLDTVLNAGTHHSDLEQRVTRIEDHLGLPRAG